MNDNRKTLMKWMLALCMVTLVSACGGDSDSPQPDIPQPTPTPEPTPELSVSQASFSFNSNGGNSSFNITSNTGWTVQSSAGWCTVSPTSGSQSSTINVEAAANKDTNERKCIITIKSTKGNLTKEISVTQEGCALTLDVSATALQVSSNGGSSTFDVSGNAEWTAESSADWCTVSPTSGSQPATVNVVTTANMEASVRSCTISVKSTTGDLKKEISVTQEAHVFTLDATPTELKVTADPTVCTIAVSGDDTWTAASDADWCTLSATNGTGEATIEVTVADNGNDTARTATLTITGKNTGKNITVTVTQEAGSGIGRTDYDPDMPLKK